MKQLVESTLCPGIKTTATVHLCMPNLPAFPQPSSLSSYHMKFFKCLTGTVFVKCFTEYFCHHFLMLVHLPPLSLSSLLTLNTPHPPFNQFILSPSLDQSQHLKTRGRSKEGDWRRRHHLWDIGLSSRPPSRCITRRLWDTTITGLVLLNRAG